jgi:CBS domain-containing protein
MTAARDIMTGGAECAQTTDTLSQAAQKMRELGVGALPICGEDNRPPGDDHRPGHRREGRR